MTIYNGSSLTESALFESADDVDDDENDSILPLNAAQASDMGDEAEPAVDNINRTSTDLLCAWGTERLVGGSAEISYAIRTESDDLICVITVSRITAEAGDVLQLWLSFQQCTQGCHCVRASLMQREIRSSDGALLKVFRSMASKFIHFSSIVGAGARVR